MNLRPFWSHTAVTCFIISWQSSCFMTCIKSWKLSSIVSCCTKANTRIDLEEKKDRYFHILQLFFFNLKHVPWLFLRTCRGMFRPPRGNTDEKKLTKSLTVSLFLHVYFSSHYIKMTMNYIMHAEKMSTLWKGTERKDKKSGIQDLFQIISAHVSCVLVFFVKGQAFHFAKVTFFKSQCMLFC